ncbi:MAG: hypothetical protein AAFX76_11300 [Planctomycetota bacterium]
MAHDGWSSEESQFNQIGTGIAVVPAILAALLLWGVIPVEVTAGVLFAVVAVCGVVGGVINILGRGPIWAGALLGLLLSAGGFGAVYLWAEGRESVRWFEVAIAFVVGAAPSFVLQLILQRVMGSSSDE